MYMCPKGFRFESDVMRRVSVDGDYLELIEIE